MINKSNLNVPSILIIYVFISLVWMIIFKALTISNSTESILMFSTICLTVISFSIYIDSNQGCNFNQFIGTQPQGKHFLELLALCIIMILVAIGSAAAAILVESNINFDHAIINGA